MCFKQNPQPLPIEAPPEVNLIEGDQRSLLQYYKALDISKGLSFLRESYEVEKNDTVGYVSPYCSVVVPNGVSDDDFIKNWRKSQI